MELRHEFTVPAPVEEVWAHFQDIAEVADCFPGGHVTAVNGDSFEGTVKVKLGPIALVYHGSGRFVEKDASAHRFLVDAQGRDKRGNGTAGAKVTLAMSGTGSGSGSETSVEVLTDLSITGKPAQFGRGVMQDVSDKLLGQFVSCLEHRLSDDAPTEARPAGPTSAPVPAVPVSAGSGDHASEGSGGLLAASGAGASGSSGSAGGGLLAASSGPSATGTPLLAAAASAPAVEEAASAAAAGTRSGAKDAGDDYAGGDDALDLGTTVLPILARTYWKQALGVAGALVVLRWLTRR